MKEMLFDLDCTEALIEIGGVPVLGFQLYLLIGFVQ
jgi:hypothetical protein